MLVTKQEMERVFRKAGYRMTRQREAIFDYLFSANGDHPSARQVFEGLKDRCLGLSVATVYNTLGTLVRLGIIKIIEFEAEDNRYEKNLAPHVNLICRSCGSIEDLDVDSQLHIRCARDKAGFMVSDCRLEYYGRCGRCLPAAP